MDKRLNAKLGAYRIEIGNYVKLDMFKPNEESRWLCKTPQCIISDEFFRGEYDEVAERYRLIINDKIDEIKELNKGPRNWDTFRNLLHKSRRLSIYIRDEWSEIERLNKVSRDWVAEGERIGDIPKENYCYPIVTFDKVK